MSWSKIHAMGLSKNEKLLYAGNSGGEILILDVEQFKIIQRIQAHAGTVVTIFAHPVLPFVASLSKDRTAKLWRIKDDRLTLLHTFNSREDAGDADAEKYNPIHSTSQALAFHPIEARVVWRAGTGAIVEVEFTDETYKVLRRFRASPMNGVAQIWYDLETQGIFCATIKGDLVLMKDGVHMRSWKFFDETIHWMEPIGKNRYLLAGDSRRMIDFNSVNSDLTRIGEAFARDDFEHVTQCGPRPGPWTELS